MAKKTFFIIAVILVLTFVFAYTVKYIKPSQRQIKDLTTFPLVYNQWQGKLDYIDQASLNRLNRDQYFNATYSNSTGQKVQLFFDYFMQGGSSGGVHSPRNCLPGSGWAIMASEQRQINIGGRIISANRLHLKLGEAQHVMDFWYITRRGETANDYKFKIYTMLSSLTLQPTDVAFIRFIGLDTPSSLQALDDFEKTIVPVIYSYLPY